MFFTSLVGRWSLKEMRVIWKGPLYTACIFLEKKLKKHTFSNVDYFWMLEIVTLLILPYNK